MLRSISAFFTVVLAMVLSVVLAVPASADASSDFWANYNAQLKTTAGGNYQYKYGFDYRQQEWRQTATGQQAINSMTKPALPVSPTVNPSSTGASWYLNQYRNRALNPANIPLEGKIIEPGKTVVRAPSTYTSINKYQAPMGGGFVSALMGSIGLGLGGTATPPSNWAEIAHGQGIPTACTSNVKNCVGDESSRLLAITGCGNLGTCNNIGAISGDDPRDAVPLFDNLWAILTGQEAAKEAGEEVPSDTHTEVNPRGCKKEVGYQYRGENNGTVYVRVIEDKGRPPSSPSLPRAYYDGACYGAETTKPAITSTQFRATCIVKATGVVAAPVSSSSGTFSGTHWNADGTNKYGMCANPATETLMMIQFWYSRTQAQYDASPSMYDAATYSEWINPDPMLNTIEDTKITTSWDCADSTGAVRSYSQSITKTAAFIAPECPHGSELIRHDVKAQTGTSGDPKTIDSGAKTTSGTGAYPDCQFVGCTMQVFVDGSACAVSRPECSNWPAVLAQSPSRVVCKWGSYNVPVSDCLALSNGYKTETGVVYDPRANTWVAVDTFGNPVAPNPEPWNPTNPNPTPGVTPGTPPATTPGTGTPGFPTTGTQPSTDNCSAPTWSWNPVEFVKNPVVCALIDAFVPKVDIQARMDILKTTALDTAPISWINPVIVGPGGSGCPDWNIVIPGVMTKNVVCESSFTSALVGVRGPMFGLITVAMVWPLLRSIWYAAIPVLRVTPASSK